MKQSILFGIVGFMLGTAMLAPAIGDRGTQIAAVAPTGPTVARSARA